MNEVKIKIDFNAYYSENKGVFNDGGIYPILEYLNDNKLKDALVRLDVDDKNKNSWEEVDLFCKELSINSLDYTVNEKSHPKYTANVTCNFASGKSLIKMLIEIGRLGNCGHSYTILINDKRFSFDADGAVYISSINGTKLNHELFSNINKQIDTYNKGVQKEDESVNESSCRFKITENDIANMVEEAIRKVINKKIV